MRRLFVSVLAAFAIALGHAGAAFADTTPSMTVSPNTGLVDGQTVTVTSTGFPAMQSALVGIYECKPNVIGMSPSIGLIASNCAGYQPDTVGEGSNVATTTYHVSRVLTITTPTTTTFDCAKSTTGCVLTIGGYVSDESHIVWATAPIKFAPK